MSEPSYRLVDVGDARVLTVDGRAFRTHYSERVVRMLIARKGARRAALYFPFKEARGAHFLGPLVRYLDAKALTGLAVLEVGCSFAHITEYLAERPAVARTHAFDPDPAFVADGSGWQNATLDDCLPSWGLHGLEDLTEAAGYGWRFFRDTARSPTRRTLLPLFSVAVELLRKLGRPPSLCLPYLNLLLRKSPAVTPGA